MPAAILGNQATVIAVYDAFYDLAPGNPRYANQLAFADGHGESAYAAAVGAAFANVSNAALSTQVLHNMGITASTIPAASYAVLESALASAFAAYPTERGQVVLNLTKILPTLESDATFGAAASAYNASLYNAYVYSVDKVNIGDGAAVQVPSNFRLTPGETAGGTSVAGITGNRDVVFNFDNPNKQISGLDLDGDGVVEFDGIENNYPVAAANFHIVDASSRNPLNQSDSANNFLGDLRFDGRSFGGDGVGTNGNVVLGGLGADIIFGGVGNDFLTGGGVARDRFVLNQAGTVVIDTQTGLHATHSTDDLSGGRNADFLLIGLAPLDA